MKFEVDINSVGTIWFNEGGWGAIITGGSLNKNTIFIPVFKDQTWGMTLNSGSTGKMFFIPYKY